MTKSYLKTIPAPFGINQCVCGSNKNSPLHSHEPNGDAVVSSDTMNDTKIGRNLNITIK